MLVPLSRLAFIIGAWLVLEWISKSSEFAGIGVLNLRVLALLSKLPFCYRGVACMRMDF